MERDPDQLPASKTDKEQPRRAAIPFEAARRGIRHAQPIQPLASIKPANAANGPGLLPRSLPGTGPIIVLCAALLCTLYPGLHRNHAAAAPAKPEPTLLQSDARRLAQQAPAKPSAGVAAQASSPRPVRVSHAPGLSSYPAVSGHAFQFEATHKKAFGSCTGQLELTSAALRFRCSHQPELEIPVTSIAGTHKNGIVLTSGEKYHFLIANENKSQVETILSLWLTRARQSHQPGTQSLF